MNDQELLKKLNSLKEIKPDSHWREEYRGILFSQISAGSSESKSNIRILWQSIVPRHLLVNLAKPVWLASLASIFILVTGIGSVYASKNSKPGDSLYIAKIISERAQFAITFDEKNKVKLGVEFATNRAKEMIQVLEDTNQATTVNNDKLEKLSQNFKKEISQVKDRLSKAAKSQVKDDESEVFGANLGKNDQRMEIAEPTALISEQVKPEVNSSQTDDKAIEPVEANATSTVEQADLASPPTSRQADQLLEEAEKLVDEKNINGAIDKLEEVNKVIDQSELGKVEGASETATSTN